MTTITMKSQINSRIKRHIGNLSSFSTYGVQVECEDNEHYDFEVDANSYGEACMIAESMAHEMYVDILYIQVEQVA